MQLKGYFNHKLLLHLYIIVKISDLCLSSEVDCKENSFVNKKKKKACLHVLPLTLRNVGPCLPFLVLSLHIFCVGMKAEIELHTYLCMVSL